jgi:hypothetical protein
MKNEQALRSLAEALAKALDEGAKRGAPEGAIMSAHEAFGLAMRDLSLDPFQCVDGAIELFRRLAPDKAPAANPLEIMLDLITVLLDED